MPPSRRFVLGEIRLPLSHMRAGVPRHRGGGSGPPTVAANAQAANVVDVVAYPVTPGPAANALNITVPITRAAVVVGAPRLSVTYSGTLGARYAARPGVRPAGPPGNWDRPQQPDHSGSDDHRRQTPHPHDPTRNCRLHHQGGCSARPPMSGHNCRLCHPETWRDGQFSQVTVILPTVKGLSVLQRG